MIITLIILVILIIIIFYNKNTENFTTKNVTQSSDLKKEKCDKYVIVKDSLIEYIDKLNDETTNKNLLITKNTLPYNLNNTDQYNILNNYGIKNLKKKNKYINNINNNQTVAFNSQKLLKNYNNVLNYTFYKNSSTLLEYPKLNIINYDKNIQYTYDPKFLNDSHFYLYFNYLDNISSNLISLKLTSDLNHDKFNINIHHNHNNYLCKLEYKGTKNIRLFIVLKKNKKIILKSNEIKIKN